VSEFDRPSAGANVTAGAVYLLGGNASVDVPVSLDAKKAYSIAVEGRHDKPPPVVLALRFEDNPTTVARFVFDKGDDSLAWQQQPVVTHRAVSRLRLVFVNDYTGPEGDRNAAITRLRVLDAETTGPLTGGEKGLPGYVLFTVGAGQSAGISSKRPLPTTSPLLLDYAPLRSLDNLQVSPGDHLLVLPEGWSASDVNVSISREYAPADFTNLSEGTVIAGGAAHLLGVLTRFDVATSLTANTRYTVSVEGQHSVPPPVIVVMKSADDPTTLATFTFAKGDRSFAWEEQTISTTAPIRRLHFLFVNDYNGPDGDRNAVIRRIRIIEDRNSLPMRGNKSE